VKLLILFDRQPYFSLKDTVGQTVSVVNLSDSELQNIMNAFYKLGWLVIGC